MCGRFYRIKTRVHKITAFLLPTGEKTGQIISCVDLQLSDQYFGVNSSQGTSHELPVTNCNDDAFSKQGFLSDKSVPSSTEPDCCLPTDSCNQVQAGSFSNIKSGSFHNLPTKPCQSLQSGYRLYSGSYSQLQSEPYSCTDSFHELESVSYSPLQSGSCNDIQSGSGISSLSKPIPTSSLCSSLVSSCLSVQQTGDIKNLNYNELSKPVSSDTLTINKPYDGRVVKCRSLGPSHGENVEYSRETGVLFSSLQGSKGIDVTVLQPLLPPTITRDHISLFQYWQF